MYDNKTKTSIVTEERTTVERRGTIEELRRSYYVKKKEKERQLGEDVPTVPFGLFIIHIIIKLIKYRCISRTEHTGDKI